MQKILKAAKTRRKLVAAAGVSGAELGLDCDVSKQRVSQLEADGTFVRNAAGRFDRRANVIRYIRRVRDESRENSRSAEAKRFVEAKARAVELRNARLENDLIPIEDVAITVEEIFTALSNEMRGFPASATRDLAVRAEIQTALDNAFDRCRARIEKLGGDLAAGRGVVFDDDAE